MGCLRQLFNDVDGETSSKRVALLGFSCFFLVEIVAMYFFPPIKFMVPFFQAELNMMANIIVVLVGGVAVERIKNIFKGGAADVIVKPDNRD